MRRLLIATSAVLTLLPSVAAAHMPWLLPSRFDATKRDHVTVLGSFSEVFFEPEVVMKSDVYAVVDPAGAHTPLSPTYLSDITAFEVKTGAPGTYRITTGQRTGRTAKAYHLDGKWVFMEAPDEPPPKGAVAVDMQSLTKAEVYVSNGAPTAAALTPTNSGIEFKALTHPNDIFAGQDARFQVLYDGKPLPGQVIEMFEGKGRFGSDAPPKTVTSDAQGGFAIKAPEPGLYYLITRYRTPPASGQTLAKSFTYALTFEAAE